MKTKALSEGSEANVAGAGGVELTEREQSLCGTDAAMMVVDSGYCTVP